MNQSSFNYGGSKDIYNLPVQRKTLMYASMAEQKLHFKPIDKDGLKLQRIAYKNLNRKLLGS